MRPFKDLYSDGDALFCFDCSGPEDAGSLSKRVLRSSLDLRTLGVDLDPSAVKEDHHNFEQLSNLWVDFVIIVRSEFCRVGLLGYAGCWKLWI